MSNSWVFIVSRGLFIIISKLVFRIKISGRENIPTEGGYLVAGNHISFVDPPLIGSWIYKEVFVMAKKELFDSKFGNFYFTNVKAIRVNRGAVDRSTIKRCKQIVNEGKGVVIFPEGTRSKTDQFLPAKPGVGLIAAHCKCPIVPAYIHGSNKLKDCFWGREKFSITYGKPISVEEITALGTGKEAYQKISELTMERIGQIKKSIIS